MWDLDSFRESKLENSALLKLKHYKAWNFQEKLNVFKIKNVNVVEVFKNSSLKTKRLNTSEFTRLNDQKFNKKLKYLKYR